MNFFENFSGLHKLLIFVLVLTIVTFGTFYFTTNFYVAITVIFAIYLVLYISKNIWIAHQNPKLIVALGSLALLSTIALSFGILQNLLQALLQEVNQKYFPQIKIDWENVNPPAYLILGFTIIGITIINYFFSRDNSAMGTLVNSVDKDIPDRDFKSRFKSVCEELESDLRNIDQKTNWSVQDFVPLDAEVEVVITNNNRQRKITDLLGAIRKSKDRTFLVLGDPGSGKSVALRKMCRDLLKEEAKKVYKIPLYINLKEWKLDEKWTYENPPTVIQLRDFVLKNIKGGDISTARFFETYFDRLYETGRIYFIMDSFDEIPAVLNEKDNSELIDQLSNVLFKFLKGARDEKSQGILSSRIFRKPTSSFQTKTTLEIRPFTESKIIQSFKNRLNEAEELVTSIFKDKRELTSMVRNPFLATLIIDYIKNNNKQLPENQSITYRAYLEKTLTDSNVKTKLDIYNLTKEEVFDGAILISQEMFERKSLEVPINDLRKKFPLLKLDEIINVLKYSRLGRGNERDDNQFSFVHRRFAEYFYVQYLIRNPDLVDVQAIPNDSQMRDALVLYCEVGEFSKVKEIADFCWSIIKDTKEVKDRKIIHSLRFLVDAFRGRIECIQHFRKDLSDFLESQIHGKNDIISMKIVIESVSLLEADDLDRIISKIITYNNFWLNDIAINSCRHLNNISKELENRLCEHMYQMNIRLFLKKYLEYTFSFKLSESFKKVSMILKIRKIGDISLTVISFILVCYFILNDFLIASTILNPVTSDDKSLSFFSVLKFENLKSLPDYEFKLNFVSIYKSIIMFFFANQLTRFSFLSKLYHKNGLIIVKNYKLLYYFLIFCMCMSIMPLIIFMRNNIFTYYFSLIIVLILFLIIVFCILAIVFYFVVFMLNDFLLLRNNKLSKIKSREEIESIYKNLKLPFNKEKLIRFFENNQMEIGGSYSNNFLNVTEDNFRTRLAKLEEKWLKLDN